MKRVVSFLMIPALCLFLVPLASAGEQLPSPIATGELAESRTQAEIRAEVEQALAREDVRKALISAGVEAEMVEARLDELSPAEMEQLAAGLDELPAGGNNIVGAAVFVFIVLLVTDLLGLTDVFPFTR